MLLSIIVCVCTPWEHCRGYQLTDLLQESVDGLYVCLYTFLGFGKEHVLLYHKKTGRRLFLHIKRTKKEQRPDQDDKEVAEVKKPTKLALGKQNCYHVTSIVILH